MAANLPSTIAILAAITATLLGSALAIDPALALGRRIVRSIARSSWRIACALYRHRPRIAQPEPVLAIFEPEDESTCTDTVVISHTPIPGCEGSATSMQISYELPPLKCSTSRPRRG